MPLNTKLYPVKKDELIKKISEIGFELKDSIKISNTHFGLIFIKK